MVLRRALRHGWRCSLVVFALVLLPSPAAAHPFGAPQQIEVAGDGERGVRVRWLVGGTDDLTVLGVALGVLGEDRVMLDGAVVYEPADGDALAKAPDFTRYLTERITVTQHGRPCPGTVTIPGDLASDGADVRFACPEPVGTVTVTSRMLTDLHEAYRTLARGPDGQKAVYDAAHESADWSITPGAATDAGARPVSTQAVAVSSADSARQLAVVGGVLLVAVVAGTVWLRRRGKA